MTHNMLNRWIDDRALELAPFNSDGLSVTPTLAGMLFARIEDEAGVAYLRLFENIAPVSERVAGDAGLLLSLLALSGPGALFGTVRLGIDPARRFFWASDRIAVTDPVPTRDALGRFEKHAEMLRKALLERLSTAAKAEPESTGVLTNSASTTLSPASSRSTPEASRPAEPLETLEKLSVEELSSLMANPSILWG